MARIFVVLAAIVALVVLASPQGSYLVTEGNCTQIQATAGLCPSATVTETEVVLESNGSVPNATPDGDAPGTENSWSENTTPADPLAACLYILNSRCLIEGPARTVEAQPITWADIAAFSPTPGAAGMEPHGWAVIGLETNFYASSAPHIVEGTLLGQAAAVRFTPVAFHWDYGDGTSASLATAGSSWAELGVGEFGATPTSHVFGTSGDYTVTLAIEFAAEYRVAGLPWTSIAGTIEVASAPLQLTAGSAATVLVNRECTHNPQGPGC